MRFDRIDELNKFIDECFIKSFKNNKKIYDKTLYAIDYVIMHDKSNGKEFMIPLCIMCKCQPVLLDALKLIKKGLKKFDLLYASNDYAISVNGYKTYTFIDTDNSIASFKLSYEGNVILTVAKDSNKQRHYDFKRYLNNNTEYLMKLHECWDFFVNCYYSIYKYFPDKDYEFLCSEGVEQIKFSESK